MQLEENSKRVVTSPHTRARLQVAVQAAQEVAVSTILTSASEEHPFVYVISRCPIKTSQDFKTVGCDFLPKQCDLLFVNDNKTVRLTALDEKSLFSCFILLQKSKPDLFGFVS